LEIPVRVFACGREYLEVIKHPRFGRGKNMNPCIDCRIHMFSRAKEYMHERGADFVATGEVLGERPMSQRKKAMETIARESGLDGRIVRPLSAQLLPPSLPEQEGLVDRQRLKAIQGRRRLPQFELARELKIEDYLCPAGGCLLADKEFAARFAELLEREPDFGLSDARLLRLGRHFRLPGATKVVVGRNEDENSVIENMVRPGDILLMPHTASGPSVLCRGKNAEREVHLAASLLTAHITKPGEEFEVEVRPGAGEKDGIYIILSGRLVKEAIAQWRISSAGRKAVSAGGVS
jgi:tRNA U34 2-thiouridine synthase MnmA/TrmU